jgi:hypothetical protein
MGWMHFKCMGETKSSCDNAVIWNCPSCRNLGDNILKVKQLLGRASQEILMKEHKTYTLAITQFTEMVRSSTEIEGNIHQINNTLQDFIDQRNTEKDLCIKELKIELEKIKKENQSLLAKICGVNTDGVEDTHDLPNLIKPKAKTLFAGDSMVGRTKPKTSEGEVRSLPGGTIPQLIQAMKKISTDYNRVVLLVGTNDCDSDKEPEVIVESYKELIQESMKCCPHGLLTVSGICP